MYRTETLPKSMEDLRSLSDEKLQSCWEKFYKYSVKGRKSKFRPLWYAIQCELEHCKLPEKYITRLERYSKNPEKYIQRAHKSKYNLAIGTILTKKYKGKIYQVVVKGDNSYEWDGKSYSTLSGIACEIVRGHVSGPQFFGVSRRANAKN